MRALVGRTARAVRIVLRDGGIPKPLRWLGAVGLAPVPGPFDEILLLLVAALLFVFYRGRLARAWREAGVSSSGMPSPRAQIEELARSYTAAWCSRDAAAVASHYVPGGTIAINGGEPAGIGEVAASFIAAFPDITVYLDELVVGDEAVEYRWTFTGTSSETGKWVRIPGSEVWTIGADGLIETSTGSFDEDEYERQLRDGAGEMGQGDGFNEIRSLQ